MVTKSRQTKGAVLICYVHNATCDPSVRFYGFLGVGAGGHSSC